MHDIFGLFEIANRKYYNVKIIETKDLWYEFDDVSDYESFFQRP